MKSLLKHSMVLLTACLWLVANPAFFGCAEEDEDTYGFGESEMRTFVEGTWTGSMTLGESTTPFTLVLQQSAATAASSALCGERSFVKPAAACIAISSMPVTGTLSTDDGQFDLLPVSGCLDVMGAQFDNAQLWVSSADGLSFSISSADGEAFDGSGSLGNHGGPLGSFTMSRVSR